MALAEASVLAMVFHLLVPVDAVRGASLGMAAGLTGACVAVVVRSVLLRRFRLRRLSCPLALLLAVCAHLQAFSAAWPPTLWVVCVASGLVLWVVAGNVVYRLGPLLLIALSALAGALLL